MGKPKRLIERIVHEGRDLDSAADWDIEQQVQMTPRERMRAAKALKDRVYGTDNEDVREHERRVQGSHSGGVP